jgi:hypothetical protein
LGAVLEQLCAETISNQRERRNRIYHGPGSFEYNEDRGVPCEEDESWLTYLLQPFSTFRERWRILLQQRF